MKQNRNSLWSGEVSLCKEGDVHLSYDSATLHIRREHLPHLMLALVEIGRRIEAEMRTESVYPVLH